MPSKRLFIALPVPENLANSINNWVKTNTQGLKIRPILAKNLHITLIPPWGEDNIEKLYENIRKIGLMKAFELTFYEVSFGPTKYSPRLIWATGESSKNLNKIKGEFEKILMKKPKKRTFLPHLTIARFRPVDFKYFSRKNLEAEVSWRFSVRDVCVYQSHLSRKGADYQKLFHIHLGGD